MISSSLISLFSPLIFYSNPNILSTAGAHSHKCKYANSRTNYRRRDHFYVQQWLPLVGKPDKPVLLVPVLRTKCRPVVFSNIHLQQYANKRNKIKMLAWSFDNKNYFFPFEYYYTRLQASIKNCNFPISLFNILVL